MLLADYCPHCKKRRFLPEEGEGKHRYCTKRVFGQMWKQQYGKNPMGKLYKMRCEFCKRNLALFADHKIKEMQGRVIVLYLCTMSDTPYDPTVCAEQSSCHKCPIPKQQAAANTRMWSL